MALPIAGRLYQHVCVQVCFSQQALVPFLIVKKNLAYFTAHTGRGVRVRLLLKLCDKTVVGMSSSMCETCIYMHIHAFTCIYMHRHAYTCIYLYMIVHKGNSIRHLHHYEECNAMYKQRIAVYGLLVH